MISINHSFSIIWAYVSKSDTFSMKETGRVPTNDSWEIVPSTKTCWRWKGYFWFLFSGHFSMALLPSHPYKNAGRQLQEMQLQVPKAVKRHTDIFSLLCLKGSTYDKGNDAISGNPASTFCTAFLLTSINLLIKGEMYHINADGTAFKCIYMLSKPKNHSSEFTGKPGTSSFQVPSHYQFFLPQLYSFMGWERR